MRYTMEHACGGDTFETYRAGESNAAVTQLLQEAAARPGTCNPVFLYGSAGTGKTHLLHAMAARMFHDHPHWHVEVISCSDLVEQLISLLVERRVEEFRNYFSNVDAILVDDIQELSGKQATQTELIRIFDALVSVGKQVVLTADRKPGRILAVEDRLLSRFQGGLLLELNAPDLAARQAIVADYTQKNWNCQLSADLVIMLVSKIYRARNLQGAAAKLCAHIQMTGKSPDMEDAFHMTEPYWTGR